MKKRLRKKLKLAEFQELGFFATGSFNAIEDTELDMFFERLIEFVESHDMQCGGGYNSDEFEVFVNTGLAGDDNEAGRQAFIGFLEGAKTELKEFTTTELLDAYYDHDEDCHCGC